MDPVLPNRRLDQLDIVKGLAIIGVIVQHGATPDVLRQTYASLHVGQAVPLFFLVLGANLAGSILRRHASGRWSVRDYLLDRARRLLPPFFVAFALALVIGALDSSLYLGPFLAIGALPVEGPGTYFITALFQAVVVLPVLVLAFRARPRLALACCFALSLGFEAVAIGVGPLPGLLGTGPIPYWYDGCVLRYLGAIGLGVWLAVGSAASLRIARALYVLAMASIIYLIVERGTPGTIWDMPPGFERRANVLVVPYAFTLLMLALRWLPSDASDSRVLVLLVEAGRASYHIFLLQILWFALVPADSPALLPAHLVACLLLGWLFYRFMPMIPTHAQKTSRVRAAA